MITCRKGFSPPKWWSRIPVKVLIMLLMGLLVMSFGGPPAFSQQAGVVSSQEEAQPPASAVTPDPWPKIVDEAGAKYTIYQPQMDSWNNYFLNVHAAVSVLPAGAKEPVFGVINLTAYTVIDRQARTVSILDITVMKANFPSAPAQASQYQGEFQAILNGGPSTISLDRLQAALAVEGAEKKARQVPVMNNPPKFVFSQTAAVLIIIDGEPIWYNAKGPSLKRIINTRSFVVLDSKGNYYLHLFNGFIVAPSLSGPWTAAKSVPPDIAKLAEQLSKEGIVDLMEGATDERDPNKKSSLSNGIPRIVVATTPTELIVTEGPPDWVPIEGGMLLYVNNTTGNIFKDISTQQTYVLVTGRWFRAPDFNGPWQYVAAKDLPPDFANIPDENPKENVKASVPGTTQAQEAVIANEIPQTAVVYISKAKFKPRIKGAPVLKPIPNTIMNYVFNSPDPIIMVSPKQWCAVQNGVWFVAASVLGPWAVATSIPAVIYTIPPSSPLYYVTYVQIYDATPEYVVVGYTPGYMGVVVTSDGVVVYGTGYSYVPYVSSSVWYPPPVTYGYAANPTWTPWTGWAIGFGVGWAMGAMTASSSCCWGYSCAPYWGAYHGYYGYGYHGYAYGAYGSHAAWGPGGWAATTGNVYHQWGATTAVSRTSAGYNAWTGTGWSNKVGTSYNSLTGRASAGQRAAVGNVYTGGYAYGQRGATDNPTTGASARGGSVTYGNADSGAQNTVKWGHTTGAAGQTSAVETHNNVYATHDGTAYKNTGSGWEKYGAGGWSSVDDPKQTQSLQSQQAAREAGDQRSASSSWGSKSWGDSFGGGSGGWDRGSSGGSHSWGGGGFGGGGGWGGSHSWDGGGGGFHGFGGGGFGGGGFGGFHGGGRR
jgi:hypothetical protein